MNIAEIRQRFPQYSDLSDSAVADGFHRRFYADIPRDQFFARIGLAPAPRGFATNVQVDLPVPQLSASEFRAPPVEEAPPAPPSEPPPVEPTPATAPRPMAAPAMLDVPLPEDAAPQAQPEAPAQPSQNARGAVAGAPAEQSPVAASSEDDRSQFSRGLSSGVANLKGNAAAGLAAFLRTDSRMQELSVADRIDRGEQVHPSEDQQGYADMTPFQRQRYRQRAMRGIEMTDQGKQDLLALWRQYQAEAAKHTGRVPSVTDIRSLDDFGAWAAHTTGSTLPQMGGTLLAGLLGTIASGGNPVAGAAAATAVNYPLAVGETYGALLDKEQDRPGLAAGLGVPIAAFDALGVEPAVVKAATAGGAGGLVRRVIGGLARGMAGEAATETAQEAVQIGGVASATGEDPLTAESAARLLNAAAAGGLVGGAVGAAGGVIPPRSAPSAADQATSVPADAPAPPSSPAPQAAPEVPPAPPVVVDPRQASTPEPTAASPVAETPSPSAQPEAVQPAGAAGGVPLSPQPIPADSPFAGDIAALTENGEPEADSPAGRHLALLRLLAGQQVPSDASVQASAPPSEVTPSNPEPATPPVPTATTSEPVAPPVPAAPAPDAAPPTLSAVSSAPEAASSTAQPPASTVDPVDPFDPRLLNIGADRLNLDENTGELVDPDTGEIITVDGRPVVARGNELERAAVRDDGTRVERAFLDRMGNKTPEQVLEDPFTESTFKADRALLETSVVLYRRNNQGQTFAEFFANRARAAYNRIGMALGVPITNVDDAVPISLRERVDAAVAETGLTLPEAWRLADGVRKGVLTDGSPDYARFQGLRRAYEAVAGVQRGARSAVRLRDDDLRGIVAERRAVRADAGMAGGQSAAVGGGEAGGARSQRADSRRDVRDFSGDVRNAGPAQSLTPSPAPAGLSASRDWQSEVAAVLDRADPKGRVALEWMDSVTVGGRAADARFDGRNRIEISRSLTPSDTRTPISAAIHELAHFYWPSLTDAERKRFAIAAEGRGWITPEIKRNYSPTVWHEEAIAHAAERIHLGQEKAVGVVGRVIQGLIDSAETLLRGLGVIGFRTPEQFIRAVQSGEMASIDQRRAPSSVAQDRMDQAPAFTRWLDGLADQQVSDSSVTPMAALRLGLAAMKPPPNKHTVKVIGSTGIGDLGIFAKLIHHPRMIAARWPAFARVYSTAVAMMAKRDAMASDLHSRLRPYFDLAPAAKRKVNALLELGRLEGIDYRTAGVGRNSGTFPAALSKPGEVIQLNKEELAAYRAARETMDAALDLFRDNAIREGGLDPRNPATPKTQAGIAALAAAAAAAGRPDDAKRLADLARQIDDIAQAKAKGYVPFTRFGDIALIVRQDTGGGQVLLSRVHVELSTLEKRRLGKTPVDQMKSVQAEIERLTRLHNGPHVTISVEQLAQGIDNVEIGLSDLDRLANLAKAPQAAYKQTRDAIEKLFKESGARRHFFQARNIPGYETDFERSLSDYAISMSSYLARREMQAEMDEALALIPPQSRDLQRYADQYVDYIERPREEFAGIRQASFLWHIAGVFGSAVVNMLQPSMVTAPYLMQFANPFQVTRALTRAYWDAAKMINWKQAGLAAASVVPGLNLALAAQQGVSPGGALKVDNADLFDFSKAPQDVQAGLIEANRSGSLLASQTFELFGLAGSNNAFLKGVQARWQRVFDAASAGFSAAERLNRVATWIATARLANNPDVLAKMQSTVRGNALAQEEFKRYGRTKEAMAEWVIDETQFKMGKVNRPTVSRGIGSLFMQFKSFSMQMLELQYRLLRMHGKEGKMASAGMMTMVLMMAGVLGLPGAEDATDILEWLMKQLTGIEPDIRTGLRGLVVDLTGSSAVADMFARGVARASGIDWSTRLSMGRIPIIETVVEMFTKRSDASDAVTRLGAPIDLAVGRPTRTVDHLGRGDAVSALAEMAPNALRNLILANRMLDPIEGGVKNRSGRTVLTPTEVNEADAVLRSLGLRSTDLAMRAEMTWAKTEAGRAVTEAQSDWNSFATQRYAARIRAGDDSAILELARDYTSPAARGAFLREARGFLGSGGYDLGLAAERKSQIDSRRASLLAANEGRPAHQQVNVQNLSQLRTAVLNDLNPRRSEGPKRATEERANIERIFQPY